MMQRDIGVVDSLEWQAPRAERGA